MTDHDRYLRPLSVTDPEGGQHSLAYHGAGGLRTQTVTATNAESATISASLFQSDEYARGTSTASNHLGRQTQQTHILDAQKNELTLTSDGLNTVVKRDLETGLVDSITHRDNATTTFAYDALGRLDGTQNLRGDEYTVSRSSTDPLEVTLTPIESITENGQTTIENGIATTFTTDTAGNLTEVTRHGKTTKIWRDPLGRMLKTIDGETGAQTTFTYSQDQLTRIETKERDGGIREIVNAFSQPGKAVFSTNGVPPTNRSGIVLFRSHSLAVVFSDISRIKNQRFSLIHAKVA